MPELPDVEVYRKEAQKAQNKKINHISVIDKHFVDISKITLGREIAGKKLKEIYRRGKYLFLTTDNHWSIVMHFGMTGRLEYLPADKEAPKYTKCTLEMSDNHHLHYLSKRKLGSVDITSDSEQ